MSSIVRGGRRLSFDRLGAGRPPVLLLHGWCCDRTTMRGLAEHLARRHAVVNLDLRGHGLSDPCPEPYGSADVVGDLAAVAAATGLEHPVLVGHSLGGKFVLAATGTDPGWASAVVLLDPALEETPGYVADRRAELDRPDWRSLLLGRVDAMFAAASDAAVRRRITGLMLGTSLDAARAALEASDEVDTAAAFRDCPCPVLYVGSERPRADPRRIHELNPRAWYGQVVGAGHFVQVEALDQVGPMVDRFIAAAEAGLAA